MAMEDISDIAQWEYVDIDYPAICGQCEKVCEGTIPFADRPNWSMEEINEEV